MLQEPETLIRECSHVEDDWFFRPDHKRLFQLMRTLSDSKVPPELQRVADTLIRMGEKDAEKFGGIAYVLELPEHAPSTVNAEHYIAVLRENFVRRAVLDVSAKLADVVNDPMISSVDELRGAVANELREVLATGTGMTESVHMGTEVGGEVLDDVELREKAALAGVPLANGVITTGYEALDHDLGGGLERKYLTIVSGRPGAGKTAAALAMAIGAARHERDTAMDVPESILVVSLELDRLRLTRRVLCTLSGVPHNHLRQGNMEDDDWRRLLSARDELDSLPLYLIDRSNQTARSIAGSIYSHAARTQGGVMMVVVDYIQLMRLDWSQGRTDRALGDGLRLIHSACKEVGATCLVVSQLNRAASKAAPTLADLAESGVIEQDADVVLALDRPASRGEDVADDVVNVYRLKVRDGRPGVTPGRFDGAKQMLRLFGSNRDNLPAAP